MQIDNIDLSWLGHSSFVIKGNGKIIYIDPYNISKTEPADIILITHPHYDHCSLQDINKVAKDGTIIICPADCQSKISKIDKEIDLRTIDVGETMEIEEGIALGAVPAYNQEKQNHPKSERWLGYLLKINGTNIYHAGDTDLIPEMQRLYGKVQVALLPVGGNVTMNAQEAVESVGVIGAEISIPMHYGSIFGSRRDAEEFVKLCSGKGIKAVILERR